MLRGLERQQLARPKPVRSQEMGVETPPERLWRGRKRPGRRATLPFEGAWERQNRRVVNDNYSSLSTTIKTHCDTGLAFYVVSVSLTVPNPLGQPLRLRCVFGAARRPRRSGAGGAGGAAGAAAAL